MAERVSRLRDGRYCVTRDLTQGEHDRYAARHEADPDLIELGAMVELRGVRGPVSSINEDTRRYGVQINGLTVWVSRSEITKL